MNEKKKKTRTSITIDPDLLQKAREVVENEDSAYRSVSELIESSLNAQLRALITTDV